MRSVAPSTSAATVPAGRDERSKRRKVLCVALVPGPATARLAAAPWLVFDAELTKLSSVSRGSIAADVRGNRTPNTVASKAKRGFDMVPPIPETRLGAD